MMPLMTLRPALRTTLLATTLLGVQQAVRAVEFSWNVANGDYGTATNWNPNGNPSNADTAVINNGGTSNYTAASGTNGLSQLLIAEPAGSSGTFNLTGGELQPTKAVIGQAGTGVATLNGGFLTVGNDSLFVGSMQDGVTSGAGTLNVMGGATTQFSSGDDVGIGRNGTGTVNMSGGRGTGVFTTIGKFGTGVWNHSGGVFDQAGGDFEIGDGGRPDQSGISGPRQGTLNLTGGVIHGAGHVAIGNRNGTGTVTVSGGVLDVTGDINGTGTIFVGRGMNWEDQPGVGGPTSLRVVGDDAIIVANGGLNMNSSGVASSSTLIAEITGATHTPIKVTGGAEIANGAFKVVLNGFTPVSGNSWTIIEAGADITAELAAIDAQVAAGGFPALTHFPGGAGTLNGTFLSTDFSMAPLTPGLSWDVSYANNKVTLSVTGAAQFAADFNHDGKVNGADLTVWKGAYHTTAAGDADADGDSDGADFLVWQRQLGLGGPAVAAAGAVPEPATGWLLAMGAATLARRRR
jgi:hypothetical protein